jgi:predicted ATPase/Tfp pilus assembly protein PilF/predicted Ser/Thr protein kinase
MSTITRITDRFEIIYTDNHSPRFLGQGGMGSVYLGVDKLSGDPVAIKALKSDVTRRNPDLVERFRREGETLRQLDHPNIVKMLGTSERDGVHYLIMEYVSGGSLRHLMDQQPRFSVQRALYIALDLADALTRAHRLNVLHRDIKPANVLLADDGTPRLTDFGMARSGKDPHITEVGAIVGTLAYVPPEVFNGEEPDERSDIWAYGVMLYEMLAGQHPFPFDQPGQLVNAIMTQPVPDLEAARPDAPTALVDLIYRMLTKDRHSRIRSVRVIGTELENIIRGGDSGVYTPVRDSTGRFQGVTPNTSTAKIPNNLPAQPTPFVGRDRELQDLERLLHDNQARLLTLLGPGGMGKTRLAIALAERELERGNYPDGVFFVPLAPIDDDAFIVPTIAEALHIDFVGANPLQELLDHLAEKQALLVFDNYEHLVNSARIVSQILAVAPRTHLIVTSRERLRLQGETVYDLEGMLLPPVKHEAPEKLQTYPAVQLFMQSARRVMADFEITAENAHDVAEITRMVQGLPLGIELAAAWLEYLPSHEIVTEIESSLDFLETDLQDVPERHRSIRAVFDYSWNLMTDAEKTIFMQLSIFRGGFEREAVQRVTGANLRTLSALVNKSLLRRDPSGRYRVHQLLRQYADENMTNEALRKETCHKHALYYAEYVSKLRDVIIGSKEIEAVAAIEREIENIRMAWNWGIKQKQWDAYDDLLHPMMLFHIARSTLREGHDAFETLMEALLADGKGDSDLYWRACNRQGWISGRLGNYEQVEQAMIATTAHFQAKGDHIELAHALNILSYARMFIGKYDQALENSSDAVELVQNLEEPLAWYFGMGNLGYIYFLLGDYDNARTMYEAIQHKIKQVGYMPSGEAYMTNNLGEILRELGQLDDAYAHFEGAYAVFEQLGHRRGMAFTLNNLGGIYFVKGDYQGAREMYERSYALNREIGDKRGIGHSLAALGNSAAADDDLEQARQYYQQSLEIRRAAGDQRGIVDSMMDLANIENNTRNPEAAAHMYREALRLRRDLRDRVGEGAAHVGLSMALLLMERYEEAGENIRLALEIGREIGNDYLILQGTAGTGEAAFWRGDLAEAEARFKEALSKLLDLDAVPLMLYALGGLARVRAAQGRYEEALHIISLVLRYPRNFIGMIEDRARQLFEELRQQVDQSLIDSTMHHSRSVEVRQIVTDILAE